MGNFDNYDRIPEIEHETTLRDSHLSYELEEDKRSQQIEKEHDDLHGRGFRTEQQSARGKHRLCRWQVRRTELWIVGEGPCWDLVLVELGGIDRVAVRVDAFGCDVPIPQVSIDVVAQRRRREEQQ